MKLNFKGLIVLMGSLALVMSLAAAPASACGWKKAHFKGDATAVHGWKKHKRRHMG